LTTGISRLRSGNDDVTLYIAVSPSLINVIELIDKSKLIQSMKNGLINHVDLEFFDQSIIEGLKKLPEDRASMLDYLNYLKIFYLTLLVLLIIQE